MEKIKTWVWRYRKPLLALLVIGVCVVLVQHGWAQDISDDEAKKRNDAARVLVLSQQLYCQIKDSFSSKTGLIIGLLIAIAGIWRLIKGNVGGAVTLILIGALLSAVPSLLESVLGGIGTALGSISARPTVPVPNCGGLDYSSLKGLSTDGSSNQ